MLSASATVVAPDQVYSIWSGSLLRSLRTDAVLAIVALIPPSCVAVFWRPLRVHFLRSQAGLITVEFILLLPLLMASLLTAFQVALIMQAKFVVNYAAFCAVRSAAVLLPEAVHSTVSNTTESFNQMDGNNPNAPKVRIVRRAAALACAGISPPMTARLTEATGVLPDRSTELPLGAIAILFAAEANGQPVSQQLLLRAPYALSGSNTTVTVTTAPQQTSSKGTAYTVVTAKLKFRYYLTVPFADRLLGKRFLLSRFLGAAAYYAEINEQYSLTSEQDHEFPDDLQKFYLRELTLTDSY